MIGFILGLLLSTAIAEEALHISSSLTIKVQKKEVVADQLVAKAEEVGGYYSSRSDNALTLKVPVESADEYLEFATQQGLIAERSFNSHSLSQVIADLEARLKTREELLEKYFEILEGAGSDNVIAVENEVIRLVTEIENLKGQLRRNNHLTTYADVSIQFQFRDRRAPVSDGSSSFEWINTLNITDVMQAFQYSYTSGSKASGTVPEGFAKYQNTKKDIKAASADGLLYRIKVVKPNPQADNAFWAEAVSKRMHEAGYHPYEAKEVISAEEIASGMVVKCLAPSGEDDLAYWISFKTQGNKLIIIEALGEASTFRTQEEQIIKAIENSFQ
jgi:hypothetical protein